MRRQIQKKYEVEAMIPSIFGNITTMCAKEDITDEKLAMMILHMYGNNYYKSKKVNFSDVVKKKRKLIAFKYADMPTEVMEDTSNQYRESEVSQ